MVIDFSKCKSPTAIKNAARDVAFSELLEMCAERFGADNVSIVGNAEIAVAITTAKCADGTENEVCFTIQPKMKDFDDRVSSNGKRFNAYERLVEADTYEVSKSEKEKAAEQRAKDKQAKIERDKKAREKRKAEKEKARQEKDKQSLEDNG